MRENSRIIDIMVKEHTLIRLKILSKLEILRMEKCKEKARSFQMVEQYTMVNLIKILNMVKGSILGMINNIIKVLI